MLTYWGFCGNGCNASGRRAEPGAEKPKFAEVASDTKPDDVNFHTLCHRLASRAGMRGVKLKELQELLGRASLWGPDGSSSRSGRSLVNAAKHKNN